MTEKTETKSYFTRFFPQNFSLVLLLVMLCLAGVWLYCLMQPPIFRAEMQFSLNAESGVALDGQTRQEATALILSQAVYQDIATLLSKTTGDDFTQQEFYQSLFISQSADKISLSVFDKDANNAKAVLATWFQAYQEKLKNYNTEKKALVVENDIKERNNAIASAVTSFREALKNGDININAQSEFDGLYAQLVATIGNRIAYDAQIAAIVKNQALKQSPLNLEFIAQDNDVANLSDAYNQLIAEIAFMKVQLGEKHPQIRSMEAQAKAINKQLEDKINLSINYIYSNAEIARVMEQKLREQVQSLDTTNTIFIDKIISSFEQKIQTIWKNYQDNATQDTVAKSMAFIQQSETIHVERQSIFIRYKDLFLWVFITSLTVFWLFMLLVEQRREKKIEQKFAKKTPSLSKTIEKDDIQGEKTQKNNKKNIVSLSEFYINLEKKNAKKILLVGEGAAKTSAKLALLLKQKDKNILLIDVSAKQIENLIGPHRGFTDVLTGDARISEVIYKDYETDIDIVPKGIANATRAQEFANDIDDVVKNLQKDYARIIFVMDVLPDFGLSEIYETSDCISICSHLEKNQKQWQDNFEHFKTKTTYYVSSID